MDITALVMAGGRGNRMVCEVEKPLLLVAGKPMVVHVLEALSQVSEVDRLVVAVSRHTPKTAEMMKKLRVEVVETSGEDYVSDTWQAVEKLRLGVTLTVSADLPLLSSEVVQSALDTFYASKKPALAVMVPHQTLRTLGLKPDHDYRVGGKSVSPVGLNVIDGRRIEEPELEQENFILDRVELAANVNSLQALQVAERLYKAKMLKNLKTDIKKAENEEKVLHGKK